MFRCTLNVFSDAHCCFPSNKCVIKNNKNCHSFRKFFSNVTTGSNTGRSEKKIHKFY